MSTPSLAQARSHYTRQRRITAAAVRAVRLLFKRNTPIQDVVRTVATYQLASAMASSDAITTMAGEADRLTVSSAFAGVSSAGFPISEPIVALIDQFAPAPVAPLPDNWWSDANVFIDSLSALVASEVQDAGRTASQAEFVARPEWQNYVRMLNPPSCSRCAILAGRIYKDLEAFQRHPNCFPAGTVVSGPSVDAATRRFYEGELVVLRTASGQELSVTGNHPILTDQGWVPANLLKVGDEVVRSTASQGAAPLVIPDEQQAPSLIEDAGRANGMVTFGKVPTAAQDFHGDGGHGEVDVVLRNGFLRNWLQPARTEFGQHEQFAGGVAQPPPLSYIRATPEGFRRVLEAADSLMGSSGLYLALLRSHPPRTDFARGGLIANGHALSEKSSADHIPGHPVPQAERILALASAVRRRDVVSRQILGVPRWDAPPGPLSVENRMGYATQGKDLRERLTSQIAADRVIKLDRVSFSGHVYNLTSSEGWFSANSLIVSNCDCVMVPVQNWESAHDGGLVSSAQDAFDKGQIRGLSKADTQAIKDGANINQVVNAAQGITTADAFGHRVKATTASTTKRSAWRKANPTRLVRLRPESIYKFAADREDAIRLLRLYGYIT